jgi:hypothetical protein
VVTAKGFQVAGLFATQAEWAAALWAAGTLTRRSCLPISGATLDGQILKHTYPKALPALVKRSFYLAQGCFGMLLSPFAHTAQDFSAQGFPSGIIWPTIHAAPPLVEVEYQLCYVSFTRSASIQARK